MDTKLGFLWGRELVWATPPSSRFILMAISVNLIKRCDERGGHFYSGSRERSGVVAAAAKERSLVPLPSLTITLVTSHQSLPRPYMLPTMKLPFVFLTLSFAGAMAWFPTAMATPVISEIVAVNDGSLEDKDGDTSAWVEIYNTSTDPIDLIGHYATDDADDPTKFQLPRLTIPGESYGLLFLSGKDFNSLFQKEVHTSFTFGTNDDYFAIVAPDGSTIVDVLEDIDYRLGMSYGRVSPDGDESTLFKNQTPLEPNRNPVSGVVADTKFSVDRGFFTEPFEVEITTKTEGARILYTTSGREPNEGSIFTGPIEHVYDGPIMISETTVLRAAAFKDGLAQSNVDTQTYIFASDVGQQEEMTGTDADHPRMAEALTSIPTISLAVEDLEDVTVGGDRGSDNDEEFQTSVEFLQPDGTEGIQIDAGVSRFGGYFTNFDKENFRLHFRKRYGAGRLEYPVYRGHEMGIAPAEEFDAINLRSGSHDMFNRGAYLSNRFIDDTLLEMGHIAPHGRFVHVYINGFYWGQYHLRERWNAPMFASYFGGPEADYDAINGNNQGPQEFLPGDPFDGDREFWSEVLDIATQPNPFANIQNHVDMGSYLAFQLTWLSGNSESEFQAAGSREQGIPFKFYFKDADGYLRPVNSARRSSRGPGNIFREMNNAEEPDYQMFLADTIHKHYFNDGAFTRDRNLARLQRRIDETELSMIAESARWNYRTLASWQTFQDNLINNHFPDLTKDMIRAFRNEGWYPDITAPTFLQRGGEIEAGFRLQMTVGTIFNPQPGDLLYTIDGTDPRAPGGAVADGALTYERNGPGIRLEETATVKARIHDPNGEWSALTEATYHLGRTPSPGDLVISEIHYRPAVPSPAEVEAGFDSRSPFEFIEIYNRSDAAISLLDVVFNDGIRFDFAEASKSHLAPGEVAVIVGDQAAFALRYGTDIVPEGQFASGRLSNGGESLRLSRRSGEILQELRYNNNEPWPEAPDGTGKSLTLKDPTALPGLNEPDQWQASNLDGGTPGTLEDADPGPGGGDEVDQDGDGLPAFAETALGTSDQDPSSGVAPFILARDDEGLLTITLRKAPVANASQFQLEISNDLETWSTAGFSLDDTNGNPDTLRWTREDADAAQSYIRLVISSPE